MSTSHVSAPRTVDDLLAEARSRLQRLTPTAAAAAVARGAVLVDIRPHAQRAAHGEVPGALVVERNVLEWRFDPASSARLPEASHDLQVVVLCQEGYTSSLAAAVLRQLGVRRSTDVVGGFVAWQDAGLPTVAGGSPTGSRSPGEGPDGGARMSRRSAGHEAVLPRQTASTLVVAPPQPGPGAWAGAPSAVAAGGTTYLAYRLRRPLGEGRGFCNVVASVADGETTALAVLHRERFSAESLERPALVRTPEGRWRLYVSCATPGTKHWRVDLLEADRPEGLADAPALTVLPGSTSTGVKDPVVVHDGRQWHLWASVHPLEPADDADRMTTEYATSPDGVAWTWHGTALAGRPGSWDARGVRVTSVRLLGDRLVVTYDGRATAAQNWEETTGTATGLRQPDGTYGPLTAAPGLPLASPHGGLRYLAHVDLPGLRTRVFYETTRADGAHELRAEVLRRPHLDEEGTDRGAA